jgi:sialate O-acetylesterase
MREKIKPAAKLLLLIVFFAGLAYPVVAATELPLLHPLFCDHAVLQRDAPVPVWGWTTPGAKVVVTFAGQTRADVAGPDGKWMVKLQPMHASSESRTLTVSNSVDHATVSINDVLVGDVWLCAGQSNMEFGMQMCNSSNDIATANFPDIRLLTVPHEAAVEPQSIVECHWLRCNPTSLSAGSWNGFSAVGFYFGRELHQELNIPIGLIQCAWGGTIAQAWTSAGALATMGDFNAALAHLQNEVQSNKNLSYPQIYDRWYSQHEEGSKEGWQNVAVNDSDWETVTMPQPFSRIGLGSFDGTVWFRHEFIVPNDWLTGDARLALNHIDDEDTTWINGVEVGQTHSVDRDRNYIVHAALIKPGTNVIAIRVLDTIGEGGLLAQPGQMRLISSGDSPQTISLDGDWQMKSTLKFSSQNAPPPGPDSNNPNVVTYLFNGMISPLLPYGIKGAIWYQGESNADDDRSARQYHRLLPTMIQDWRTHFGEGNFPFYIVQLANYQATNAVPRDHPWAELREAQALTAKNVPNSGLAVTIDIGDANSVHPKDKRTVGHRLALIALAKNYGRKIEYSGPTCRSMKVTGNHVSLKFDHAKGGLIAKDGPLTGFAVAGADGKFVWATAEIRGDSVVLLAPGISQPVAVRYALDVNPVCDLYNQAGLPAVPFRMEMKSANQ